MHRWVINDGVYTLTRPFSKYGLKPGLQARGVFSNHPLRLSLRALHILDLCCNFQYSSNSLIALSPSKISPACKTSLPSMRAVRSDSFISPNSSCTSAFVLYKVSTNSFSVSKFSSRSCSAMNSRLDSLEQIGSGSFLKASARCFLRNFSMSQITLSRYL